MSQLSEFIQFLENPQEVGRKDGKWFYHESPEGGLPTLGYGHKLTQNEYDTNFVYGINLKYGCSDEEIEFILTTDLEKSKNVAKNCVPEFEDLDNLKQDILTEFAFNLGYGLNKFKKFKKAIIEDDWSAMKAEYKRFYRNSKGVLKELQDRNDKFYHYFLSGHP